MAKIGSVVVRAGGAGMRRAGYFCFRLFEVVSSSKTCDNPKFSGHTQEETSNEWS